MTWDTLVAGLAGAVVVYLLIAAGGWAFDRWYDRMDRNNKW